MKNLLKIFFLLSIVAFSGCKNVPSQEYENVFYTDFENGVVLAADKYEFCKVTGTYCEPNDFLGFNYAVDNKGQIYLYNSEEKTFYVFEDDGHLKDTVDLKKYSEKLSGIRGGLDAVFIDSSNEYVYVQLHAMQNAESNYVYARYSINSGSVSEFKDEKYRHNNYAVKNGFIHTAGNTVKALPEDSLVIDADENYLYYLGNLSPQDGSFPKLIKATKSLSVLESVEIPVPYKIYTPGEETTSLFWDDVFVSDSGEVYISFFDKENDLWYIKKYIFQ